MFDDAATVAQRTVSYHDDTNVDEAIRMPANVETNNSPVQGGNEHGLRERADGVLVERTTQDHVVHANAQPVDPLVFGVLLDLVYTGIRKLSGSVVRVGDPEMHLQQVVVVAQKRLYRLANQPV